jgi:hypothetical protein
LEQPLKRALYELIKQQFTLLGLGGMALVGLFRNTKKPSKSLNGVRKTIKAHTHGFCTLYLKVSLIQCTHAFPLFENGISPKRTPIVLETVLQKALEMLNNPIPKVGLAQ